MIRPAMMTVFLLLVLLASSAAITFSMSRSSGGRSGPVMMDVPASVVDKLLPNTGPLGTSIQPLNVGGSATAAAPSGDASLGRISRIAVNGEDVAHVMGLQLYKFRYQLPAGENCTIHLFEEVWSNGAKQPEITLWHTNPQAPSSGEIFLQLPTHQSQRREVNLAGASAIATARPLTTGSETTGYSALEGGSLTFSHDVTLLQVGISANGLVEFGKQEAIAKNDVTVFYKVRMLTGIGKPFEK